jgi:hypothetical protein
MAIVLINWPKPLPGGFDGVPLLLPPPLLLFVVVFGAPDRGVGV